MCTWCMVRDWTCLFSTDILASVTTLLTSGTTVSLKISLMSWWFRRYRAWAICLVVKPSSRSVERWCITLYIVENEECTETSYRHAVPQFQHLILARHNYHCDLNYYCLPIENHQKQIYEFIFITQNHREDSTKNNNIITIWKLHK